MSESFDPNTTLVWFYLLGGAATLSMAGILWVAWHMRRDPIAGLAAMLMLWVGIDMLAKGVLRSPQAIVSQEQVLYVSRMATIGIVTTGAWLVDAYLSAHNGHLSMLRRLVLWYRGDDDPIWQRWRDGRHGHGA